GRLLSEHLANINKMAGNRRSGSHGRADQMGTPTIALTTLEVAVGGRGAVLARLQTIGVHGQTHGATRIAPLEAGSLEDQVQTFTLGLLLDPPGTRHHHCLLDAGGALATLGYHGCGTQILDARVGAGADEYPVDRNRGDRLIGLQAHVLQGSL